MQISTLDQVRLRPFQGQSLRIAYGARALAGLACVLGAVSAASAAHGSPAAAGTLLMGSLADSWTALVDWVAASYARAPALVLGLAALVMVPPLALAGLFLRRREAETLDVAEMETQLRRRARGTDIERTGEPRDGVKTGHIPLRPLAAWIEIVDKDDAPPAGERRFNLARTLIRIGRESDNDVCIADTTVHRYHAAIRRTEDAEFVITDLSSAGGNGVVVNGREVSEARLANGDVIELGRARIRFSAAPAV